MFNAAIFVVSAFVVRIHANGVVLERSGDAVQSKGTLGLKLVEKLIDRLFEHALKMSHLHVNLVSARPPLKPFRAPRLHFISIPCGSAPRWAGHSQQFLGKVSAGRVTSKPSAKIALDSEPLLEKQLLRILTAEDEACLMGAIPQADLLDQLETAGFDLVSEREADLAAALQPTAVEGLTVRPTLSQFDDELAREIYSIEGTGPCDEFLYGGRVLIWRRGFGSEGRVGRLILEKLDYLQASLAEKGVGATAGFLVQCARVIGEVVMSALPVNGTASIEVSTPPPRVDSLNRTSLADIFNGVGPRDFFPVLFGRSNLSEPTFSELIVAFRRSPPKPSPIDIRARAKGIIKVIGSRPQPLELVSARVQLREAVLDAASAFKPPLPPLELRLFSNIPIANFGLVLPDSRPSFGWKDWLRLDLVSAPALLAALATLRYDNGVLNLAAASAVTIWAIRTLLAYRNTLVRYELLLNRFLREKTCIGSTNEVRLYVARESRIQLARRSAALFSWLRLQTMPLASDFLVTHAKSSDIGMNELRPALDLLERLGLVTYVGDTNALMVMPDWEDTLQRHWGMLLQKNSLDASKLRNIRGSSGFVSSSV